MKLNEKVIRKDGIKCTITWEIEDEEVFDTVVKEGTNEEMRDSIWREGDLEGCYSEDLYGDYLDDLGDLHDGLVEIPIMTEIHNRMLKAVQNGFDPKELPHIALCMELDAEFGEVLHEYFYVDHREDTMSRRLVGIADNWEGEFMSSTFISACYHFRKEAKTVQILLRAGDYETARDYIEQQMYHPLAVMKGWKK